MTGTDRHRADDIGLDRQEMEIPGATVNLVEFGIAAKTGIFMRDRGVDALAGQRVAGECIIDQRLRNRRLEVLAAPGQKIERESRREKGGQEGKESGVEGD